MPGVVATMVVGAAARREPRSGNQGKAERGDAPRQG